MNFLRRLFDFAKPKKRRFAWPDTLVVSGSREDHMIQFDPDLWLSTLSPDELSGIDGTGMQAILLNCAEEKHVRSLTFIFRRNP